MYLNDVVIYIGWIPSHIYEVNLYLMHYARAFHGMKWRFIQKCRFDPLSILHREDNFGDIILADATETFADRFV